MVPGNSEFEFGMSTHDGTSGVTRCPIVPGGTISAPDRESSALSTSSFRIDRAFSTKAVVFSACRSRNCSASAPAALNAGRSLTSTPAIEPVRNQINIPRLVFSLRNCFTCSASALPASPSVSRPAGCSPPGRGRLHRECRAASPDSSAYRTGFQSWARVQRVFRIERSGLVR
jgi:hypothetical protein